MKVHDKDKMKWANDGKREGNERLVRSLVVVRVLVNPLSFLKMLYPQTNSWMRHSHLSRFLADGETCFMHPDILPTLSVTHKSFANQCTLTYLFRLLFTMLPHGTDARKRFSVMSQWQFTFTDQCGTVYTQDEYAKMRKTCLDLTTKMVFILQTEQEYFVKPCIRP